MIKETSMFNKYSDEELIEVVLKENVDFPHWGLILLEEDYEKYFNSDIDNLAGLFTRRKELNKYLNDYITVKRYGHLSFYHYSPREDLEYLKASILDDSSNLSFCSGIYCFSAEYHTPIETGDCLYTGEYYGYYLECLYDCDPKEDYNNKGEGNLKEFVLLTDKVDCKRIR